MGVLIKKSDENISSAKLLIENNCYASSVHCSYYSSVQIMIHLLLNKFGYTPEKLEADAKSQFKGSHIFARDVIRDKMKDLGIRFKAQEFYREIGELKNKREQADYQEKLIDKDFSESAVAQADNVNLILEEIFKFKV